MLGEVESEVGSSTTSISPHGICKNGKLRLQESYYNVYLFFKVLKGYCTVFHHALKSLEITASVLFERMSKTARKIPRG